MECNPLISTNLPDHAGGLVINDKMARNQARQADPIIFTALHKNSA